jgi:hypothetical protein
MNQTTLQFPSIIEMLDFQIAVGNILQHYNMTDFTLTAEYSEADIELAKAGFKAIVVETPGL